MRMNHKPKQQKIPYRLMGTLFGGAGLALVLYLWIVLGDRGLHADETLTAGYTTGLDVVMMISTTALIVTSIFCFFRAIKSSEN